MERVNFQRQAWSKVYLIQPDVIKFACNLDSRGCDRMVVKIQIPMQSVPITTKVLSLNPVHGEVYSIQHYVIKFVTDGSFLQVLRLPLPIILTATI